MTVLKATVLVDNNTLIDKYYTGEPAFSLYLETSGCRVLFDAGYSDVFLRNAQLVDLDLAKLDAVALSHGHNDHTWGLSHLIQHYDRRLVKNRPLLIAHPHAFERKRADGLEIGMTLPREVLNEYFEVKSQKEPYKITDKLTWLGEIPRVVEPPRALGKRVFGGIETDDFCLDDTAMVYEGAQGLVIFTGCSHSGICNIIDYARKITGCKRVRDLVGGFHMQKMPVAEMNEAVAWLSKDPPEVMHPCHCTDLAAKAALSLFFNVEETGAGLNLDYD